MDDLASFLTIVSALNGNKSIGISPMLVPPADAEDARRGATTIPDEVTQARRAGKDVKFNQQSGNPANWYWQIDGSDKRIMHD